MPEGPKIPTLTPAVLMENDRAEFFRQVFRSDIELEELLAFYQRYDGPLFGDQLEHLNQKLESLLTKSGILLLPKALFGPESEIQPHILQTHFPSLVPWSLTPIGISAFEQVEILPGSPNELRNTDIPPPLNQRSWCVQRPPFSAIVGRGGNLFVAPHQYQYFLASEGCYYPAASLRAFSTDVLKYERRSIDVPVVLIQDRGDGSNFAHFAFDWITRVMHVLEFGLLDTKSCVFVMGGTKGPFQEALISALIRLYDLNWNHFFFPTEKLVLNVDGPLTFFSDQRLVPLHPAQLAHPRSIELLQRLSHCISSERGKVARIFVSRGDAKLRKIENEAELIGIAERRGFQTVRLGELSIQEQIVLIRGARQIVGPHGMGLTHILFSEGPLSVLELFHPSLGTDAYSLISRALGFDYRFVVGETLNDNRGSYRIDAAIFAKELDKVLD
jgi:capsular polysaccharide biosynthesis protein